jgi:hypothetical protein
MRFQLITIALIFITITTTFTLVVCNETQENLREKFIRYYTEWTRYRIQLITDPEIGFSSRIAPYVSKIYAHQNFHAIIKLGAQVVPYIFAVSDVELVPAVEKICKIHIHEQVIRDPIVIPGKDVQITFEEFPEILTELRNWQPGKEWLLWWLEGGKRTPQWFSDRYSKWLVARKQGDAQKTKAMYQKLLDIGIAAIPLWLEKLQSEQDESIRQEIMKALSYLTDGEVNLNMSPQECLKWWEANRGRWEIPFPKSKKEFLEWLEREGWEEQMLSIPSVITISRLEDEEAIDVLIRFLRHPNPLVRGTSLGRIMILFGEQLPKEYALGVGTDGWETIGDLIEMGKYEWVEKKVKEAKERMRGDEVAEGVAKEIFEWWQNNRGRVKIYWQRAWGFSE